MPPESPLPFRLPARFAPLSFFLALLLLLFAIYLFYRSASGRITLQNLQKQHHLLLDQKRILEGQVAQLQAEHRAKEGLVRLAENEMNLGEQKQLASHLQQAEAKEKQARQKAQAAELELALRKSATSKEVEVLFDGNLLLVRFYEATLFDPGALTLSSSGKKLLTSVAQSFNQNFPVFPIRVEGHSDAGPIPGGLRSRFPSTWELTAFRAATVARTLQEVNKVEASRLTSAGKGSIAPLASNDSREGRAKNRRIDIVIDLEESPALPQPATP